MRLTAYMSASGGGNIPTAASRSFSAAFGNGQWLLAGWGSSSGAAGFWCVLYLVEEFSGGPSSHGGAEQRPAHGTTRTHAGNHQYTLSTHKPPSTGLNAYPDMPPDMRELMASPLSVSKSTERYCSRYVEDAKFGAEHDAYTASHGWDSMNATAEYEHMEMDKAVRWAIGSIVKHPNIPTATLMVLPAGADRLRPTNIGLPTHYSTTS
jgi:hypothetical protein